MLIFYVYKVVNCLFVFLMPASAGIYWGGIVQLLSENLVGLSNLLLEQVLDLCKALHSYIHWLIMSLPKIMSKTCNNQGFLKAFE